MGMETAHGDKISFERDEHYTVMTIVGPDKDTGGVGRTQVDLITDDLMELQNELYMALHGRPDPEIEQEKVNDERVKRLVKEAIVELVNGGAPAQPTTFVQNISTGGELKIVDIVANGIVDWLYGDKPKVPRPRAEG